MSTTTRKRRGIDGYVSLVRQQPLKAFRTAAVYSAAASMLLDGQRDLSKKSIMKLADHFKLEPGYFL